MILAIQTDGPVAKLGLYRPGVLQAAAEDEWEAGRALADDLLGRISQFLKSNGAQLDQLTGIAIYSGPGSFTSLRIGHSVANALADSLGVPIAGGAGDSWVPAAISALDKTPLHQPALPVYGAEANITKPARPPKT